MGKTIKQVLLQYQKSQLSPRTSKTTDHILQLVKNNQLDLLTGKQPVTQLTYTRGNLFIFIFSIFLCLFPLLFRMAVFSRQPPTATSFSLSFFLSFFLSFLNLDPSFILHFRKFSDSEEDK
ncbi:unnamed protein product [Cuscuta europaea]|uniref:Transmembrane protein n=1 Tax=Cuscuta europaea TaxID=41803 RepID=A0A9P1E7A3_CUSEU|nr:unnamed protein product [Cuscuta europaea]